MKRWHRILINLFGPPFVASMAFILTALIESYGMNTQGNNYGSSVFLTILGIAYIVATIPSLLHMLLMERLYKRFPPFTWKAILCSTLSGTASGILITTIFGYKTKLDWAHLLYPALGSFVGFVLGLTIKTLTRKPITP